MQSRQKITRDFPKAISSTQSESSALPSQVSFHSKLQLKPFSAKCPPGNGLRWWYCWHLPSTVRPPEFLCQVRKVTRARHLHMCVQDARVRQGPQELLRLPRDTEQHCKHQLAVDKERWCLVYSAKRPQVLGDREDKLNKTHFHGKWDRNKLFCHYRTTGFRDRIFTSFPAVLEDHYFC